jgi:membrane-bound lytic murein transglycosylase B
LRGGLRGDEGAPCECRDDNIGVQVEILLPCGIQSSPSSVLRSLRRLAPRGGGTLRPMPQSRGDAKAGLRRARRRARLHRRDGGEYGFRSRELARVFRRRATSRRSSPRWIVRCSSRRSGTRTRAVPVRRARGGGCGVLECERTRRSRAAEERYGVPAEIVVAIIGVETFYGRIAGNYRVLDALATLAFDYPRRARSFAAS